MSVTINHQTNDISSTSGSLTIDGSAAGGGAWNLISTTTVTSAVTSVDFTGLTSYDHYVAVVDNIYMSADNLNLQLQMLNNGVPDTTSYRYEHYYGNQGTWAFGGSTSGSGILILEDIGNLALARGSATINISGLNANTAAVVYSTGVTLLNNTARYGPQISSGANYGTYVARDGVRFKATSGSISGGVFALYGIAN
tara:strand:+ start:208 stop:798 length:591 start_codon:yes stop_codon:yes gene_type:complete